MSVSKFVCVCMCLCGVCGRGAEVNHRCLPASLSTVTFETESLTESRFANSPGLAGNKARVSFLLHPPTPALRYR